MPTLNESNNTPPALNDTDMVPEDIIRSITVNPLDTASLEQLEMEIETNCDEDEDKRRETIKYKKIVQADLRSFD